MNNGRITMDTTPDELLRSNILKESGIREPLYISALKNAHVIFDENEHLDSINELNINKYRPYIEKEFKNAKHSIKEKSSEKLIEIQHVNFAYEKNQVLKDITFDIHRGERISIIGKNGAGKTTLARLLCGIIRPQSGEVKIKDQNYLALSIREIGRMIGYVMQNPNQMLVKDMIKDEIALALQLNHVEQKIVDEKVEMTLKMCGLYEMRNWPVAVLSYGQRKRVTIASILALQPDVIILDEPTAGQDYHHYTEIMNFIEEINEKYQITILFITHDMHLAIEYTDRSIVFADGECIADDYVYKVLSNNEIIQKANLKQTSLVHLANLCGIDPEEYIHHFIEKEREVRKNG
ncbi:MAG: DUF3744 domain-containing protein, partial [Traorella sp.]